MDQVKIGKFIAGKRKGKNLTQAQLAERLNITDRAVSKWETGRSLPDSSVMVELCELFGITVNELLTGEDLEMKNYNEKAELNLIEMKKQKEASDKRLLAVEIVIGIVSILFLFTLIAVAAVYAKAGGQAWLVWTLILAGGAQFIVCMLFALRIEQKAGYYECPECGHRYVPTFGAVNMAMHIGRTRYMKCPNCGKRSWQKKVLNKED